LNILPSCSDSSTTLSSSMATGHLFMLASALLPLALAGNHLDANNLVYRSPYTNHDGLALDTHAIAKRHDQTTELLRKRQLSQPAPEGDVGTYTLSGYGLGATDWSNSDRIYAGDVNFSELDVSRCSDNWKLDINPLSLIAHSVASGDPYDYSVLLWTRAEPTAEAPVDIPVCVTYKVYTGQDGTVSLA
jgi:alkaline phosphatase D